MDYEKAYKEARERASKLRVQNPFDTVSQMMEYVFSELAESEDERIRKNLIGYVKGISEKEVCKETIDKWIAWLEEQGKQKSEWSENDNEMFEEAISNIHYAIRNRKTCSIILGIKVIDWLKSLKQRMKESQVKESDVRYKYLDELLAADDIYQMSVNEEMTNEAKTKAISALSKMCISELLGLEKNKDEEDERLNCIYWLEKQNHDGKKWIYEDVYLKEKEQLIQDGIDEVLENPQKYGLKKQCEEKLVLIIPKFRVGDEIKTSNEKSLTITKIDEKGYWSEDLFICDFDEECLWDLVKQKSADKVESKFRDGDWVVWDNKISCHIDNVYQGKESLMYTITDANNMTRSYSVEGFDNNAHLWTIEDAKNGDVLVASDNSIFIYAGVVDDGSCIHHIAFVDGSISTNFGLVHCWERFDAVKPATKEQHAVLFEKMREAGYEWNADKKELRKIEQVSAWSEEDEIRLDRICKTLWKNRKGDTDEIFQQEKDINWLKSLKQRML